MKFVDSILTGFVEIFVAPISLDWSVGWSWDIDLEKEVVEWLWQIQKYNKLMYSIKLKNINTIKFFLSSDKNIFWGGWLFNEYFNLLS